MHDCRTVEKGEIMSEFVQEVYEYLSKKTDEINKLLRTSEGYKYVEEKTYNMSGR